MIWTILVSLVVGLGGGVIGSFVTARAQRRNIREARRREAKQALWNYVRALKDMSDTLWNRMGYDEEQESFAQSDWDEVRAARQVAYNFQDYLPAADRELVTNSWIAHHDSDDHEFAPEVEALEERADRLAKSLAAVFGEAN